MDVFCFQHTHDTQQNRRKQKSNIRDERNNSEKHGSDGSTLSIPFKIEYQIEST